MYQMTILILEIKSKLDRAIKNTMIPISILAEDQDMDWEWMLTPKQIPDFTGDFNSKLPKLTPVPNQSEAGDSAASADGEP